MLYYKDFKYLTNIIKNKKYLKWCTDSTKYNKLYWDIKYDSKNKFYTHYYIITNLKGNITNIDVEYETYKIN